MKIEKQEFEVQVPKLDGTGIAEKVKVDVPVKWDEELKEWLMTPEAHEIIDNTKARLTGLLLPIQFKELRERYDYSQKEMGELFQVGEKSWTRWESGKQRPSRSINLLICALYEGEISINFLLKRAGRPLREEFNVSGKTLREIFSTTLKFWHKVPNELGNVWQGGNPVLHQNDMTAAKHAIVGQLLLKATPYKPGKNDYFTACNIGGQAMPKHRCSLPPTHSYRQPRLTNIPTEA